MKRQIIGIFILLLTSWSCENVIHLELENSNPEIVIEGSIHNSSDTCFVKISRTTDYFSDNTPEKISGATILLENELSQYSFTERDSGIYYLNKIGNLIPTVYTLTVTVDNKTYEAQSSMTYPVAINYLTTVYKSGNLLDDAGYVVNFSIIDPAEEKNYYRIRYQLNGIFQKEVEDYTLLSDKYFNGNSILTELNTDHRFGIGDTITVELMSIDKDTYDYFTTLLQIADEHLALTAAPDNPLSNFTNGALGYFSAYSSNTKTIIVGQGSVSFD